MKKIIISFFILLLSSINVYTQDAQNLVYSISDFSGGQNTQTSPFTLQPNESVICENARVGKELRSLTKRDDLRSYGTADTSEAITGMHRLYLSDLSKILIVTHGDEIEAGNDNSGVFTTILDLSSGDYRWQWLTWHDLAIGTDGYNQPVKTNGSDATYLGTCYAEVSTDAGNPNGTYTYKVSYYTASYEVLFNVASNSVSPANKKVNLSMIPIAPDTFSGENVIGRKVYRVESGTWKLLSNGTIANNTATTLVDNDTTAGGDSYPAGNATYTPPKGKLCLIHKNRLWIANNPTYPSRIYYSEDGSHDVFLTTSYFDIRQNDGDEITNIFNLLGKLTVSKTNSIQKILTYGDTPSSDWEITDPFSFIGCQAMYSGTDSPVGRIYLARDGIYRFDGQNSYLLSYNITPNILDILPSNFGNCWAIYHQNKYYMAYTSTESGATANDKVLVYDMLTKSFSFDTLSLNAFTTFNSGSDWGVLYSGSSSDGTVYAHDTTSNDILHRRHSDFTGTFDDMRYIPTKWGGDSESPVLEIANITAIDSLAGVINDLTGDINREDTDGYYISPVIYIGTPVLDKIYWNETIPSAGGDVLFDLRFGATSGACAAASFGTDYTNPSGSDISGETSNEYMQYRIQLSTDDIDYTPTVYKSGGYVVRISFYREGTSSESSITLHWQSGWFDLGARNRVKTLREINVYYESENTGQLDIVVSNFEGDTDTFNIDLVQDPSFYTAKFTGGALIGEKFKIDLQESSLNSLTINSIDLVYDVEPAGLEYP